MISLFPKDENFFELFRRQASLLHQGCVQLDEMVREFDRLEERARALKEVEHQGDLVAHELFERLNRTFITPLDREDIHDLASNLDDVLDAVEAIASRIVLFKIPAVTPQAQRLARIVAAAGEQIEVDFRTLYAHAGVPIRITVSVASLTGDEAEVHILRERVG